MGQGTITLYNRLFRGAESRSSLQYRSLPDAWPTNTSLACWNCCHQFTHVPVFLPVSRDRSTGVFHLSGVYCSWNCAKAYRYSRPHFCDKDAAAFLAVFAFLTCHRPKYCPTPMDRLHRYNCPCLSYSHKIKFPPPKENLKLFGGTMSINEYRTGFMIIEDIEWVKRCFLSRNQRPDQIGVFAHLRTYVYDFLPVQQYPCIEEEEHGHDEITKERVVPPSPVVMIEGIDESFFY